MDPVENLSLMGILGDISVAFSIEQDIVAIYSPQPSLSDIATLIVQEMQNVFLQDEANEDIQQAESDLQAIHDFFRIDYANAVNSGQSQSNLWDLLNNSTTSPCLRQLDSSIAKVQSWADSFSLSSDASNQTIACQALSYCLCATLAQAMLYKERAKISDDLSVKYSNWQDMRQYVTKNLAKFTEILQALVKFRQNSITLSERNTGGKNPQYVYMLYDNYTGDQINDLSQTWDDATGNYPAQAGQYLSSGNDSDWAALTQLVSVVSDTRWFPGFWSDCEQNIFDFGKWSANAASSVLMLQNMGATVTPYHCNGMLVSYLVESVTATFLLIDDTLRRLQPSTPLPTVFLTTAPILALSQSQYSSYAAGADITPSDTLSLVRNNSTEDPNYGQVSFFIDGILHVFPDPGTVDGLGYNWGNIEELDAQTIANMGTFGSNMM